MNLLISTSNKSTDEVVLAEKGPGLTRTRSPAEKQSNWLRGRPDASSQCQA